MKRICIALLALSAVACSPKAAENGADTAARQVSSTNDRATVQLAIDSSMARYRDGMLTGDTAKMSSVYTAYAMTMKPKTGASIADVGKYLSVWQKQSDGSWKMVRDISNSDKAAM